MAKRKKSDPKADPAEYRATDREKTALKKQAERLATSSPAPRVQFKNKDEKLQKLALDHPSEAVAYDLLMEALGTTNRDFVTGLLSQLANAGPGGDLDEHGLNFLLAVIKDIKPSDQLESMLAAQMAVIHVTTMTFGRRLANVENIPQQDSAGALFIKLTRTFAAHMETLKRSRTGGEQKVTVQHVNVSEGGQAIVGNVTQAGNKAPPSERETSQPLLTHAKTIPMPLLEETKQSATVPRRDGK